MKKMICALLALVTALVLFTSCGSFNAMGKPGGDSNVDKEAAALRGTDVYKTENYSINGMMMQFLANDSYFKLYKDFLERAEDANSTVKEELKSRLELDIDSPFDEQDFNTKGYDLLCEALEIGDTYKNFSGSWYDFFWDVASREAKRILALCEMAKEAGIELNNDDRAMLYRELDAIKNSTKKMKSVIYYAYNGGVQNILPGGMIDKIYPTVSGGDNAYEPVASGSFIFSGVYNPVASGDSTYVVIYNPTASGDFNYGSTFFPIGSGEVDKYFNGSFVTSTGLAPDINRVYGAGMTDDDIVDVLELSTLADKYYNSVSEELRGELAADSERVEAYFNENADSYLRAEYLTFSLIFNGGDAEELIRLSDELMKCESPEEFKTWVIKYIFELQWSENYEDTLVDMIKNNHDKDGSTGFTNEDVPSDDIVAEKKAEMLSSVARGLAKGLEENELGVIGDTTYDRFLHKLRKKIYSEMLEEYSEILVKYGKQKEKSEIDRWIFSKDRVAGDKTRVIPSDMKAGSEIKMVYIIKPAYIDERATVSFGEIKLPYEFFTSKDDVINKADEIMLELTGSELTETHFKSLAASNTKGIGIFFDRVIPYSTCDAVSEWLYDGQREVGDLEMIRDEDGYHIVYVTGVNGDTVTNVSVMNDLVSDAMEKRVAEILSGCSVEYCGDSIKDTVSIPANKSNTSSAVGGDSGSVGGGNIIATNPGIEYIKPQN